MQLFDAPNSWGLYPNVVALNDRRLTRVKKQIEFFVAKYFFLKLAVEVFWLVAGQEDLQLLIFSNNRPKG